MNYNTEKYIARSTKVNIAQIDSGVFDNKNNMNIEIDWYIYIIF